MQLTPYTYLSYGPLKHGNSGPYPLMYKPQQAQFFMLSHLIVELLLLQIISVNRLSDRDTFLWTSHV